MAHTKIVQILRKFVKRRIIDPVSISAVQDVSKSDAELRKIWDDSVKLFSGFKNHYSFVVANEEIENRIRLLVVAETLFIKREIENIIRTKSVCTYADVGDSDGSVRLLLKNYFPEEELSSVGINVQPSTVNKIKEKGLNAICADALLLGDKGVHYDIVSAFETLEHLPDPIGFLNGIRKVVDNRLVLSVPFIRHSRIGLAYLSDRWSKDMKPTVENVHIFELSPRDWEKIFFHTGWRADEEWKLMMFPSNRISRLILQPFWRSVSFEGFWFVSLSKDNRYSTQYGIE